MVKVILGCGYVGCRVARAWRAGGHEVYAVTRSEETAEKFRAMGLHPIVGDVTRSVPLDDLPPIGTLLYAIGFDRQRYTRIEDVYVDGLRRTLERLPRVERLIYVSSTGVYGQSAGERIDEDSPCEPQRAGGRACLAAERLLAESPVGARTIVLRLAGIYGPGRVPQARAVERGEPLAADPDTLLNLIHVEDVVQVIQHAERFGTPPRTYLVSDGVPVTRRAFYGALAERLGVGEPQFVPPPHDRSGRGGSHKVIDSRRMRDELQVRLKYPSYRQGLSAIDATV